jgi:hypothetical protein
MNKSSEVTLPGTDSRLEETALKSLWDGLVEGSFMRIRKEGSNLSQQLS